MQPRTHTITNKQTHTMQRQHCCCPTTVALQHHFASTAISSLPATVEAPLASYLGPKKCKRRMEATDMAYATGAVSGQHPAASTHAPPPAKKWRTKKAAAAGQSGGGGGGTAPAAGGRGGGGGAAGRAGGHGRGRGGGAGGLAAMQTAGPAAEDALTASAADALLSLHAR